MGREEELWGGKGNQKEQWLRCRAEEGGLSGWKFQHTTPKANFQTASPAHRARETSKLNSYSRKQVASGVTRHLPFTCFLSLSLPREPNPQSQTLPAFTMTQGGSEWERPVLRSFLAKNVFSHWTCEAAETESRNLMTKKPLGGEDHPEPWHLVDEQ